MWTVLTWLLVPFLGAKFGASGAALGYAIVGVSSTVAVIIAKRYVNFSVSDSIYKPFAAAVGMAVVLLVVRGVLPANAYSLSILVVVGVAVYSVIIIGIVGKSLVDDARRSIKSLVGKK
jgi:O-antigen/teichoic acid export membrane protein